MVYHDRPSLRIRYLEDLDAQAEKDNKFAKLMVKTKAPFTVLRVYSHTFTIEESGIAITVSQACVSVSPTSSRDDEENDTPPEELVGVPGELACEDRHVTCGEASEPSPARSGIQIPCNLSL